MNSYVINLSIDSSLACIWTVVWRMTV